MWFPRQEYWSGLPFPNPGTFPTQGSNLDLPHCRWVFHHWATREALFVHWCTCYQFPIQGCKLCRAGTLFCALAAPACPAWCQAHSRCSRNRWWMNDWVNGPEPRAPASSAGLSLFHSDQEGGDFKHCQGPVPPATSGLEDTVGACPHVPWALGSPSPPDKSLLLVQGIWESAGSLPSISSPPFIRLSSLGRTSLTPETSADSTPSGQLWELKTGCLMGVPCPLPSGKPQVVGKGQSWL